MEEAYKSKNLYHRYQQLSQPIPIPDAFRSALSKYDCWVNMRWKLSHLGAAVLYLHKEPEDIKATHGRHYLADLLTPHATTVGVFPIGMVGGGAATLGTVYQPAGFLCLNFTTAV